jgi:hypothetical protein
MRPTGGISKGLATAIFAGAAVLLLGYLWHSRGPASAPAETAQVAAQSEVAPAGTAAEAAPPTPLSEGAASLDLVPLPLTRALTKAENNWWNEKVRQIVPAGTQSFGGIEFHLEGVIQLRSTHVPQFRSRVSLPLLEAGLTNARMASLHLLGGTAWDSEPGAPVAEVVWQYSDGTESRSALVYMNHVRDWSRTPYEEPARLPYPYSKVVWRGVDSGKPERWFRLYRTTVGNPQPSKQIQGMEVVSANGTATFFFVAATLDSLAPGQRPDDSPDLEPTDPVPPRYLQVTVQNPAGQAVPQAKVSPSFLPRNAKSRNANKQREQTSDAFGSVRIAFPSSGLDRLEVAAAHGDYSGRKMVWNISGGDTVPASYVLKLGESVSMGGIVVDEGEAPIAGVKLSFHRFWTGADEMYPKGDQPELGSRNAETDARGLWQVRGLPPDLLDHIMLDVMHPDYMATNLTIRSDPAVEKQLRAGTHRIFLRQGLQVRGLVKDESDNPISGASVWVNERFFKSRQEARTDEAGRFTFKNVAEGDVRFSALAKGRKPDSRTFKVRAGMDEIVFTLGPGTRIRALVQNEASEPLADVLVVLEGSGNIGQGYEFSTKTGADGRFEWDGAPDGPMQFYFYKEGYVQMRNKALYPGGENVVTMHKKREIEGIVLAADTGLAITRFRAGAGKISRPNDFYADYPGMKDIADPNGRFTLSPDEEGADGVRVTADDFADAVQALPAEQGGAIRMEFRLKPSPALHGTVIGPDGTPLPGIQVALIKGQGAYGVTLVNGRLRNFGSTGSKLVTTDDSGKFVLDSPPESGGKVVAVGDPGFGLALVEQVRASGVVVLQPFGRIEGILKIQGVGAAGRELLFTLGNSEIMTDFNGFKTATDEQGKFTFEKVPPTEGQIVRLIKSSPNSWMHSHRTDVTIQPGETTYVTLGDSGAVVRGLARLVAPPSGGEPLIVSGALSTKMPDVPSFSSPAESQAFLSSDAWKAQIRDAKSFAIAVAADGTFMLDSVPPGTYTLRISAGPLGARPWEVKAEGSTTVMVPEGLDPSSPLDIGEIALTPTGQLKK